MTLDSHLKYALGVFITLTESLLQILLVTESISVSVLQKCSTVEQNCFPSWLYAIKIMIT